MQISHSGLLGAYLAQLRKTHKYPQSMVANYIGVSRQCVGHYENGIRTPGLATLKKLAYLYEVPYENMLELLEETENAYLIPSSHDASVIYEKYGVNYLKPQEEQLIRLFRRLSAEEQSRVMEFIKETELHE